MRRLRDLPGSGFRVIVLTLYSRPDCHLCEVMAGQLEPLLRGRAELRVVDISGSLELKRRYGLRIPVLAGEGEELCHYRLDRERVESYLAGASRS